MTDEKWFDVTVFGSAYEEQINEAGEYRYRRASTGAVRYYDDWTPGHAPVMGTRRPEPTPEEIAAAVKANPMRMMCSLRCNDCGYAWRQPNQMGLCPECHSHCTFCYDKQPNMLPRI